MTDVAYYLSFMFTALLAAVAYFVLRSSLKRGRVDEGRAKSLFSIVVIVAGLISGVVSLHAATAFLGALGFVAEYGHGEVIIAAAFFNLLLSLVLLIVGRMLLGWRAVQW